MLSPAYDLPNYRLPHRFVQKDNPSGGNSGLSRNKTFPHLAIGFQLLNTVVWKHRYLGSFSPQHVEPKRISFVFQPQQPRRTYSFVGWQCFTRSYRKAASRNVWKVSTHNAVFRPCGCMCLALFAVKIISFLLSLSDMGQ